jgi:hypothetical protein
LHLEEAITLFCCLGDDAIVMSKSCNAPEPEEGRRLIAKQIRRRLAVAGHKMVGLGAQGGNRQAVRHGTVSLQKGWRAYELSVEEFLI